jgi:hypothetical protein
VAEICRPGRLEARGDQHEKFKTMATVPRGKSFQSLQALDTEPIFVRSVPTRTRRSNGPRSHLAVGASRDLSRGKPPRGLPTSARIGT